MASDITSPGAINATSIAELITCVDFSAIKHKDQRRKDIEQTPFVNHPIGVARILTAEAGIIDLDVIKAALLHDTVEDTNTTFTELEQLFGARVSSIVDEVTDDKNLPKQDRKRLQIENASKLSFEARLIRLADKLYNLRDADRQVPTGWNQTRVDEYFGWAKQVVDKIRGTNPIIENELDKLFSKYHVQK